MRCTSRSPPTAVAKPSRRASNSPTRCRVTIPSSTTRVRPSTIRSSRSSPTPGDPRCRTWEPTACPRSHEVGTFSAPSRHSRSRSDCRRPAIPTEHCRLCDRPSTPTPRTEHGSPCRTRTAHPAGTPRPSNPGSPRPSSARRRPRSVRRGVRSAKVERSPSWACSARSFRAPSS